jgi:UDP-glucose 4-epimerase
MNILVLGGGGFIGTSLVKHLLQENHSVRVLDHNIQDNRKLQPHEKMEWMSGEFEDEQTLCNAMEGIDVVYHLISTTTPATSSQSSVPDVSKNVLPSIRLLEAMNRFGVKRIVFLSSGGTVYGVPEVVPIMELHSTNPIVSHGIHKLTIEKYLLLYRFQYGIIPTIIRLSNPYGPNQIVKGGQGVLSSLLHAAINDRKFEIWGDGSVIRDYIYIDDVISALLKTIDYSGKEPILNLSSSTGASVNDLVQLVEKVSGKKVICSYMPGRNFDISVNILANQLAKRELHWCPEVGLEDGIRATYNYLTSH